MIGADSRLHLYAGWFVCVSYLLGAPAMILLEFSSHLVSDRFGLDSGFVILVGAVQFVSGLSLLFGHQVLVSLGVLTVLAIGAVGCHLSIHSPLTGLPALGYAGLQSWLAVDVYRER